MASAAVYRRLASRLGRALREARRDLPRHDVHVSSLKAVLADLGLALRPSSHSTPWAALCEGPPHVAPLTDLFVNLASRDGTTRGGGPPQRLPDVWDAPPPTAPEVVWPTQLCLDELLLKDDGPARVREDIQRLRGVWLHDIRAEAAFQADRAVNICLDKLDYLVGELVDGMAIGNVLREPAGTSSRASRRRQAHTGRRGPAIDPEYYSLCDQELNDLFAQATVHYNGAKASGSWRVRIPPGQERDDGCSTFLGPNIR